MSHYSVLVLTEGGDGSDVDEALAPFDESTEVEPYVFKEHGDAVSELAGFYGEHGIDDGLRDSIDGEIRRAADGYGADPDAAIASLMRDASDIGREIGGGTGADATGPMDARLTGRRDDPLALAVSTGAYIALARAYYGDVGVDGDLNLLTTYNPNSKWDWYEIGGRWDGGIPTRDGGRTNRCRLGDIDMSGDADAYERAIEWWRVAVEGGEAPEGATPGDYRCLYSADYMRDQYGDADGYARAHSGFGTYAVLDDAGEWHEPGRMGWFGVSDAGGGARGDFARGYAEMLASFDQDLIATLVDCHI